MNRRNFLMKLGAGMIGCLIIRPTFEEVKVINNYDMLYGGSAGMGKSETLFNSLYGIPYHEDILSTREWLGFSRK